MRVKVLDGEEDLDEQVEHRSDGELLSLTTKTDDFCFQVPIVDVLEEEVLLVAFLEAVNESDDVGVGEIGQDVGLAVRASISLKTVDEGETALVRGVDGNLEVFSWFGFIIIIVSTMDIFVVRSSFLS